MSTLEERRKAEISVRLATIKERVAFALKSAGRQEGTVTLICVTKTYPVSDIAILQELGMNNFAENRESEGAQKSHELLANPLFRSRWHYQGKIQSNKIKSLASWADAIHSVDEARHVPLIARAVPQDGVIEVFLQVSLDAQPGRGGSQALNLPYLADAVLAEKSLRLMGLMAVGPLDEDAASAFSRLAQIHSDFKEKYPMAPFLSAGMSSDFEVAITHGATHVRIGSSILGSRTSQR
jgi:pyridoxal phosphate enzyme (YggS family)